MISSKDEVCIQHIPRVTTFFHTGLTSCASASTGKQLETLFSDTLPAITSGDSVTVYSRAALYFAAIDFHCADFNVQLQDVFTPMFPCASHQPAAFCKFP